MAGLTYRTTTHTSVSKESPHKHTHTQGEQTLSRGQSCTSNAESRIFEMLSGMETALWWWDEEYPPPFPWRTRSFKLFLQTSSVDWKVDWKKQQNPNQNILFDTEKLWAKFLLRTEQKNSANLSVLKWGEMPPLTENSACGFKWVFNDAIFKIGIRWRIVPHYWWHVFPSGFQVPKFQVFVSLRANNTQKMKSKKLQ